MEKGGGYGAGVGESDARWNPLGHGVPRARVRGLQLFAVRGGSGMVIGGSCAGESRMGTVRGAFLNKKNKAVPV